MEQQQLPACSSTVLMKSFVSKAGHTPGLLLLASRVDRLLLHAHHRMMLPAACVGGLDQHHCLAFGGSSLDMCTDTSARVCELHPCCLGCRTTSSSGSALVCGDSSTR